MFFKIKRIIVGVSGGIAAYKAAELTRLLHKSGVEVRVVMTEAAKRFVSPLTFQALSGRHVFSDSCDDRVPDAMAHIDLARETDAILIAPATADTIACLAHGRANDLLTALCLARECPLLIAPAMNQQMWSQAATRRNIHQLVSDGVAILGPDYGSQACGAQGLGRMLEPERLVELVAGYGQPQVLHGRRVVVTAGPTFEKIDAMRGLSNLSSGKMGFAVARAAFEAGADVTLVAGPVMLQTPFGVRRISVSSAEDMLNAVNAVLPGQDFFFSVAAVSDYQPCYPVEQKSPKEKGSIMVELKPTPDILAAVAYEPTGPFCVGFAAESDQLLERAEAKRRLKRLPLLVANLIETAVGHDENEVVLLDDHGAHPLPRADKLKIARQLVAYAARLEAGVNFSR